MLPFIAAERQAFFAISSSSFVIDTTPEPEPVKGFLGSNLYKNKKFSDAEKNACQGRKAVIEWLA